MMRIEVLRGLAFDDCLEREAMATMAAGLTAVFDTPTPRERLGLIVASDNAGTATSVQFWTDALRTGVAVASPELFPWCLANAPCGALARHFKVTGPNATLLGAGGALFAALEMASDRLAEGSVDAVIVVAVSFADGNGGGAALALRVGTFDSAHRNLDLHVLGDTLSGLTLRAAMDLLQRVCAAR